MLEVGNFEVCRAGWYVGNSGRISTLVPRPCEVDIISSTLLSVLTVATQLINKGAFIHLLCTVSLPQKPGTLEPSVCLQLNPSTRSSDTLINK